MGLSNYSNMQTKNEIRKHIRLLTEQNKESLAVESLIICEKILSSKEYENASMVFAYMALFDEVDLSPVIKKALSQGKRVALPKITDVEKGLMDFHLICGDDETVVDKSHFCIAEPEGTSETLIELENIGTENSKILFLVPGRGFTKNGNRIGRGKGFYDRYLQSLKSNPEITLAGVCFSFQLLEELPVDENDIPMDCVFY